MISALKFYEFILDLEVEPGKLIVIMKLCDSTEQRSLQDRQYTYNVRWCRVRVTFVVVEKQ
jgi:hypothetical protein